MRVFTFAGLVVLVVVYWRAVERAMLRMDPDLGDDGFWRYAFVTLFAILGVVLGVMAVHLGIFLWGAAGALTE